MGLLSLLGRKPSQGNFLVAEVTLRGTDGKGQKAQKMAGWRRAVVRLLLVLPFLGVLALLMSSSAAANSNAQSQKLLFDCVNDGLSQQLTTYKDFALQRPARMKLERLFWSKKPPAVGVTIVTGLNPSRLNQLESQCRSFHGPISAAVYVNIHNPDKLPELGPAQRKQLTDTADEIQRFHDRMETGANCQLDVMLLYETVVDDVMQVMFPVNTLRNYALLQARTRLVAMVDVDLIVSNTLLEWLKVPANVADLKQLTSSNTVMVLPAFETAPQRNETLAHELADSAAAMNKTELQRLVDRKLVYQFALYLFRQGHNCTDYRQWFNKSEPYDIEYHDGYEPWFIIDRFRNPFYDASFRGYGWNKVSHVINIYHSKYKFIAHPAGFLVHRQHSRSHADKMYQAQKKDYERDVKLNKITKSRPNNNLAGLTHRFRDKVQEDLAAGTYEPLIDEGIKKCVRELPWWDKARAADIKRAQLLRQRQRRRYLLEAAGSFGAEQQQQQQQHQGQPWSWVQWLQQQWQQLAPGLPAL